MHKLAWPRALTCAVILFLSVLKCGAGYFYWDHLFKNRPDLQMMDLHAHAGEAFAHSFRGQFRDAVVYAVVSESLVKGNGWLDDRGRPTSFVPPVTPLYYAPFVAVFGYSYKAFWIALVVACFFTALVLWVLTSRIHVVFGITTLAVFFLHPRFFLTYGLPYSEPPFFLLLALMMWLFSVFWKRPCATTAMVLGFITSASVLCRGVTLIFGFLLAIIFSWRTWQVDRSWSRLLCVAALYVGAFLLPIGTWSWRNHIQLDSFGISSGSQGVLFAGNNPSYDGWQPWWIFEEKLFNDDNIKYAETFGFKREDLNYFDPPSGEQLAKAAKRYIRDHPFNYICLTLSRGWTYLAPFHPKMSRFAQMMTASTWLLFVAGVILSIRLRAPVNAWTPELAAFVVPLSLSLIGLQALLYVDYQFRYRLPLEFILIPAVAAGWCNAWRKIGLAGGAASRSANN